MFSIFTESSVLYEEYQKLDHVNRTVYNFTRKLISTKFNEDKAYPFGPLAALDNASIAALFEMKMKLFFFC